jgi:hypothetical protein
MNTDPNLAPIDETDANKRTMILSMIGIIIIGICALFTLAFFWFQPNQSSLLEKYFPSPTATRRSANTPAPTQIPIPNLTATQQAWTIPSQSPTFGTAEEAQTALDAGMNYLEDLASEIPDTPDINQPGDVYIYNIQLDQSEPVLWSYGWCTTTQDILAANLKQMQIDFIVNDKLAPLDSFLIQDTTRDDGSPCHEYNATIKAWPQGQHQLEVRVTFIKPTNDGWNLYPAGTHTFKYIVTVN